MKQRLWKQRKLRNSLKNLNWTYYVIRNISILLSLNKRYKAVLPAYFQHETDFLRDSARKAAEKIRKRISDFKQ